MIARLRCDYRVNPLGIDNPHPQFSWELRSNRHDTVQRSYRLQVATPARAGQDRDSINWSRPIWDTQEVDGPQASAVRYAGPPLQSFTRYWWRVCVVDGAGNDSGWSAPAWWETAVMDPSLWKGEWISPAYPGFVPGSAAYLRHRFELPRRVVGARVYAGAHGMYDLHVNGERVSADLFTPGFTSYGHRVQYQTYDATQLLRPGENVIGAILTDGWYRGPFGIGRWEESWGSDVALFLMVRVRLEDGGTSVITTHGGWEASSGAVRRADLMYGEVHDARAEDSDWCSPHGSRTGWGRVSVLPRPSHALVASTVPAPRVIRRVHPRSIGVEADGSRVIDMGQVMAGQIEIRFHAAEDDQVTLSYAEILLPDGTFPADHFSTGKGRHKGRRLQVDCYHARGGTVELFQPRHTYHGFRYVHVAGYTGPLEPGDVAGLVVSTPLEETGTFVCSDPDVSRLQRNILRSARSNFIEIPTDCPQREKAGWTGDVQVFAGTALFLYDSLQFLRKWLVDLRLDQKADGVVPHTVPSSRFYEQLPRIGVGGSAGWADAAVLVPWALYQASGDVSVLEDQYESMKSWVEFLRSRGRRERRRTVFQWGDWLEPGRGFFYYMHTPFGRKALVVAAFFANSAALLSKTAGILGKTDEAEEYHRVAEEARRAFRRRHVRAGGRLRPHRQGSYALTLAFGLLDREERRIAAARLARLVRRNANRLATGFLSTPWLLWALSENGYEEVAMDLLLQREYPSWLYPITKGATTIWEAWDAVKPQGAPRRAISLNHYAFGAVGDFLRRYVGGLDTAPDAPGYGKIRFAPHPSKSISWARTSYHSIRGPIRIEWAVKAGKLVVETDVPPNAEATLVAPRGFPVIEQASGPPVRSLKSGVATFGSGRRAFTLVTG